MRIYACGSEEKMPSPGKVWNSSHPVHNSVSSLTATFENHKVRNDLKKNTFTQ